MPEKNMKIEHEEELPFGLLNNNYNFSVRIKDFEYSNVSKYIYSNLLSEIFNDTEKLEIKDNTSVNMINFDYEKKKVESNYFTNLIIEGFNELMKDTSVKESLINIFSSEVKDSNILFVSEDSFFGIINEEINNLKYKNRDVYSTNILGKAISKIRYNLQNNFIDIDLYREYCYYEFLKTKLNSNSDEEFNKIYSTYYEILQNKEKTREFMSNNTSTIKLDFHDVKKTIKEDKELQKLLIVAIDYPIVLLLSLINKEYKNIVEKKKAKVKQTLMEEFLSAIIKENNLREESRKELSYINNSNLGELKNIIYSLYENKKINTDVKLINEENILNKSIESFSLDRFVEKNTSDNDRDNYYNNFLFFEYSGYKEYDTSKKNYIFTSSETDRLYKLYSKYKVKINKQEYSSIKNYIEYKLEELKNTYKEKLKVMLNLALNNKFGIGVNKISSKQNDLQCIMYLSNNFDIKTFSYLYNLVKVEGMSFYIDEITSDYINRKSKELDVKNIISNYNNQYKKIESQELISKDLFVREIVNKKISTLMNIIINSYFYFKEKMERIINNEYEISIDSSFVINIMKNILKVDTDNIEDKSSNISDFFVNIVKKELHKIVDKNVFDEELERIVNILWNYVSRDIDILIEYVNMEKEKSIGERIVKLKEIIIKIQLSNSSYKKNVDKIIDNEEDNFLLSSIINIHSRLTDREIFNKVYMKYIIKKFQIKIDSSEDILKLMSSNKKISFGKEVMKINDYDYSKVKKQLVKFLEYYEKVDLSLITVNDPIYKTVCGILYNYNYLIGKVSKSGDDLLVYEEVKNVEEEEEEDEKLSDVVDEDNVNKLTDLIEDEESNDSYDGKKTENNIIDEKKEVDNVETIDIIDGGNKKRNIFLLEKYVENKNNSQAFSDYLDRIKIINNCKETISLNELQNLIGTNDTNSINNILNTSDNIINSRINFFRITPKKEKDYLHIEDFNEKNIYQCIKNVRGLSSGISNSEIWKINLNSNIVFKNSKISSLVFKIFIDIDSSKVDSLNYISDNSKEIFIFSSSGLKYEFELFDGLLKNIQRYKICPHFQTIVSCYGQNKYLKYNDLKNILFGNVFMNDCEIIENNIDYCLHRNLLMIINKTNINIPPIDNITDIKQFLKEEEFETIFSNISKIRDLKFNMVITEFIGNDERSYTLYNFLNEEKSNEYFYDEVFNILFQIVYTLYVMSLSKICHNDCHSNNVLLEKFDEIKTIQYIIDKKKYIVKSRYRVKIIDFDRSYSFSQGDNLSLNNELCDKYSQCNKYVKNKDMIKIFCSFYNMLYQNMDILDLLSDDDSMIRQLSEIYNYNSNNQNFCMLQYLPDKAVDDNFFIRYNSCEDVLNKLYSLVNEIVDNGNEDINIDEIYICDKLMFNQNGTLNDEHTKEIFEEEEQATKSKIINENINNNEIQETVQDKIIKEMLKQEEKIENIEDNVNENIINNEINENIKFPKKVKEDVVTKIKDESKILNSIMKLKNGGYVYVAEKKNNNEILVLPVKDIQDQELKLDDIKKINVSDINYGKFFNEIDFLNMYNKNIEDLKHNISNVVGLKSKTVSCSEKWIVKFTDSTKYFFKIFVDVTIYSYNEFINKVNSSLHFDSDYAKFFFIYSTFGLNYEQQVYNDIIKNMMQNNICSNFVEASDSYYRYSYDDLLYIIEGKVKNNYNNKPLLTQNLSHNLSRNLIDMTVERKNKREMSINDDDDDKKENINSKLFSEFKFNIIVNKKVDQFTLNNFIAKYTEDKETELYNILFQVAYTCFCLSQSKTTHNDLHTENIFIEYSKKPKTYMYVVDKKMYIIKSSYKALLFDFDRSYSQSLGNNSFLEQKQYINFCDDFSQCNEHIDNKDIIKVLCYVYKYLSNVNLKKDIVNLISDDTFHIKNVTSCFEKNCDYENYNDRKVIDKSFFTKSNTTYEIMNFIYRKLPLINKYDKKKVSIFSIDKSMFDENGKFMGISKDAKRLQEYGPRKWPSDSYDQYNI